MKHAFLFRLAVLNTFKKKLRIILALGGIALTVSIIVVLFGVQIGLRNLVDSEIKNGQSTDVVTISQRNAQKIKLDETQLSELRSISGIGDTAESVGLYGMGVYHGISLNSPVYAVSENFFSMTPAGNGNAAAFEGEPSGSGIIVSTGALEVYSIDPNDAVGKTINLTVVIGAEYATGLDEDTPLEISVQKDYTIKGIVDRGSAPVMYVSIEPMKENGLTSVTQVNARLSDPGKITSVREAIEQKGLQTTSIQDTISQINQLFDVIQNILLVFGAIVFVITVSAAFTIITLTLLEETRQIGFLRIMGLRRQDVKTMFYIQSILITTLGAAIGIVLGYFAGFTLNGYAQAVVDTQSFTNTVNIFAIPVMPTIIIVILSAIVGWVVGIIPAKRAVLINPLEELLQ